MRVLRERAAAGSRPGSRTDEHHVVLSIEGGGNRGIISGGMALVLDERMLLPAFDAVYGSSSGALTSAWLLSAGLSTGMRAWADPASFAAYSRLSNPLRRRPLIDLEWLIGEFYDRTLRLDSEHVLGNPVSFHPLATEVTTGRAVDLHPFIHDKSSLHRALRASASLPIVAGRPVEIAGNRYLDAGLVEAVPLDTPIAAGATHILVLGSRREDEMALDPAWVRRLTSAWLRRSAPGARTAFLARNERAGVIGARLARHNAEYAMRPAILTIRPAAGAPSVGRLESVAATMREGLAAGRQALQVALTSLAGP